MKEHLIIFDAECLFCHRAVKHILDIDVDHHFVFAPLKGETAADILIGPQASLRAIDSIILVENYQSTEREFWVRSRAILRVYWLNGNGWGLFGILCFLPSFIGDMLYRWLAAHRHQFKVHGSRQAGPPDRFLP